MRSPYAHFVALAALVLSVAAVSPAADDSALLRRKQEAQQRAREMARELVSSILDIQLQQLEENGLDKLPLYGDVRNMRNNIDGLVESEMQAVVELLVKAQQGEPSERDRAMTEARQKIRQVVVRLAIERQSLLRRLKIADLAAQCKRLIALEAATLRTTRGLSELPAARQEQSALSAIQDQRDVKALFLHLVQTLSEVRGWGGDVGTGAADGLRILKAARVGQELDDAGRHLEATAYADAAKNQEAVIKGLRLLLEKIEETQGLIDRDRDAALELVRDLIRRQEGVRRETRQANLSDPAAQRLVEAQAAIRKDLNKLAEGLQKAPATLPLADQAKASAYEATGRLFDAQQEAALQEQGKVLGNLAEIEQKLLAETDADAADRSAAQQSDLVRELKQAVEELQPLAVQQEQLRRGAPSPKKLAPQQEVAQKLNDVAEKRTLPSAVEAAVAKAAKAAAHAAGALAESAAAATPTKEMEQKQAQALESAEHAVENALAEAEAALADAERAEQALKIGELARAAETLERAAAVERNIAEQAAAASKAEGLKADAAAELQDDQAEVQQVAAKIAEGVQQLAPQAAAALADASQEAQEAAAKLQAASAAPGEPSQAPAAEAAEHAENAAGNLADAAEQLRGEIGQAADELAKVSQEQLHEVTPVREAVEEALMDRPDSLAERLEQLAAAQGKVRDAKAEQQRAAGRPDAARAMDVAEQIAEALALQDQADEAAAAVTPGNEDMALNAAARQEQVAEKAGEALKQAGQSTADPDAGKPLTDALAQAQQAASQAAASMLEGDNLASESSRAAARDALEQALEMAQAQSERAAQAPAGKPDATAQHRVSDAAGEAEKLAASDAPQAAEQAAKAAESSQQAEHALPDDDAAAAAAQKAAAESLTAAAAEIGEAMQRLTEQEADQLAAQAMQADELAGKAAAVDPGATQALHTAETAAEVAAETPADSGEGAAAELKDAAQQLQRALERAAADLNAREERIRRDEAVAKAIAQAARQQQAAAEQIAEHRGAGPAGEKPGTESAEPQAETGHEGQPLAEAAEQFAEVQRAAGQGAEEVSGQQQVANQPLREALDLASNLSTGEAKPKGNGQDQASANDHPESSAKHGSEQSEAGSESSPDEPSQPPHTGKSKPKGAPQGSGKEASGKGGESPSGKPHSGASSEAEMGAGFVPNSPEVTARMMAGPKALQQLASAMPSSAEESPGKGSKSGQSAKPSPALAQSHAGNSSSKSSQSKQGATSAGGSSGSSKGGSQAQNAELQHGPLAPTNGAPDGGDSRTPGGGKRDVAKAKSPVRDEPWFARLPAELRKAIQANSQRRAPRGYEERLQRYFENIE